MNYGVSGGSRSSAAGLGDIHHLLCLKQEANGLSNSCIID